MTRMAKGQAPLARMVSARTAAAVIALVGVAGPAFAHHGPAATEVTGFAAGLAHPFSGVDHLLALVAVGALAARRGGAALWALPGVFLTVMAWGVVAGVGQVVPAGVDMVLALSAVALVAAVVAGRRVPGALAFLACGAIAFGHGWAHGAAVSAGAAWTTYLAGVLAGTAVLHALGATVVATLRARSWGLTDH